jgi:ATP-binding cassette subfamily B protein
MSDNSAPALEAITITDRDETDQEPPRSIEDSGKKKFASLSQPRWRTARRIGWLLRPFRGTVSLLLLLSLIAVAIDVVPPMLQGLLVDHVLRVDPNVSGSGKLLILLAGIVSGLLAIRVASTVVNIMKGKVSSCVGTTLTAYLRNALVQRLSFLPLAYHNRNQVGALMSRVAYDTETLHTLVYHITSGLLLQSLQLVGIGVMLFYLNPKLAIVTLLPMPLIVAGSWYFTRYLQPRYNHYWDAVGKQAGGLTGMLTGIRVVKTFAQEEREIDRFGRASRHLCESRQKVDGSISTFSSLMGFVFALGGLAVWYIGGRDVLFGQMTLGSLMAFLAYLAMFYAPLTSISESTSWFSSFFATIDRIFDLLETPIEGEENEGEMQSQEDTETLPVSPSPSHPLSASSSRGGVEFRNVNFAYDKNKPVLKDVSFAVQPGEMVGIVGRSGSGKSTLVSLISRLYEVESGNVLVGGIDTGTMEPRELRRHIGMVQQEPFLFRGSIWENITYGNLSADPEEVLIAARQADAHGFIMRLPFAYESHLGEGGGGLSGGERQRLSIARALLVDPDILILDEATASIDAESERAICAAIRRFSRRRTTIAIAHRLSTLRNADRLLVFDQGRLVEQGTHNELMALDGLYSSLVRLQYSSGPAEELDDDVIEMPWLDPADTRICAGDAGTLTVEILARVYRGIVAAAAFPATWPDSLISLRRLEPDGRESEIGILRHLEQWPAAARAAVRHSVERRQILNRIEEFQQVRTCANALELTVVTADGVETIRIEKSSDGLQRYGRRGLLLIDGSGRYYVVPDRDSLPKTQQQLLGLYFGEQI